MIYDIGSTGAAERNRTCDLNGQLQGVISYLGKGGGGVKVVLKNVVLDQTFVCGHGDPLCAEKG